MENIKTGKKYLNGLDIKPGETVTGSYKWGETVHNATGLVEWSNDHAAFIIRNEFDVFYLGELSNIQAI